VLEEHRLLSEHLSSLESNERLVQLILEHNSLASVYSSLVQEHI
jgi:hypothetical protein